MNNLIGAIVIAAAVGGAIIYTGHQDRLQRQCLAALTAAPGGDVLTLSEVDNRHKYANRYSVPALTGSYCSGWGWRRGRK